MTTIPSSIYLFLPIQRPFDFFLFENADDFEALSYVWGDTSVTTPIVVNDSTLRIGKNLRLALFNLRLAHRARVLWADAICINQGDLEEQLRELEAGKLDIVKLNSGPAYDATTKGFDWPDFRGVILQYEWWRRAWTLQEIILPKKAMLVIGTYTIDFDMFSEAILHAERLGVFHENYFAPEFPTIEDELLYYLASSHERAATNSRDKIFAILGLFKPGELNGTGIQPDYSIEPEEIYRRATKVIIENSCNLDVLGCCYPYKKRVVTNLPSWVPDWGSTGNLAEPLIKDAKGQPRTTHASGGSACWPVFRDNGKTLLLRGYAFDTIAQFSVVQPRVYFDDIAEGSMDWLDEYFPREGFPVEWADNPDNPNRPLSDIAREIWELAKGGANLIKHGTIQVASIAGYAEQAGRFFAEIFSTGTKYPGPEGRTKTDEEYQKWLRTLNPVRRLKSREVDNYLPEPIFNSLGFVAGLKNLAFADGNDTFGSYIRHTTNRRVGITGNGRACLLPRLAEVGDHVVLLKGGRVPVILRPREDDNIDGPMEFIGEAYVYGAMDGELWAEIEDCCGWIYLT
ncbi:hypothetical protein QBC38DRAFT_518818 [Podospora fimiseda]|uniref:Heterokaryon incompatibility domain-containing protein n=1 Tax=Podospora fimiseda TaxID=252190 RepID=A0AAN6YR55_9PEZI|nr:hypothetical protein QBC38DRAFT_518818 [Podospora fimiseda]